MNKNWNLVKISTYATLNSISVSYVHKLIKEKKLKKIVIDDVIFIDKNSSWTNQKNKKDVKD